MSTTESEVFSAIESYSLNLREQIEDLNKKLDANERLIDWFQCKADNRDKKFIIEVYDVMNENHDIYNGRIKLKSEHIPVDELTFNQKKETLRFLKKFYKSKEFLTRSNQKIIPNDNMSLDFLSISEDQLHKNHKLNSIEVKIAKIILKFDLDVVIDPMIGSITSEEELKRCYSVLKTALKRGSKVVRFHKPILTESEKEQKRIEAKNKIIKTLLQNPKNFFIEDQLILISFSDLKKMKNHWEKKIIIFFYV